LTPHILKQVNYDKIKELTQDPDENPTLSQSPHGDNDQIYQLKLSLPRGSYFLHLHFISQSALVICKKLQKLEEGPQTPQQTLVNMVFKVFSNREQEAKQG
jgi:hypothetical protein